jgi:hypothetical protein
LHIHYDKSKLLDNIASEYALAERTLALVPVDRVGEAGVCGYWSVKDLVSHLTDWERRTLRWIADAQHGTALKIPEEGFGWHELDALNEFFVQQFKDYPYATLLDALRKAHADILMIVNQLIENELAGGGRMTGMFIDSPSDVFAGNTFQHFELHIAQIREWLNKRS